MGALLPPILVLAALCWWFSLEPLAQALAHASAHWLLVYLVLTTLIVLGYAWRWRLVGRAVGASMPFARLVSARLAGDAVGSLVPSGKLAGEPLRVVLTRDTAVPPAQTAAAVAIDRLLEVVGNTLAVIGYVAVYAAMRGAAHPGRAPIALAVVMTVLLIALATLLIRLHRGARPLAPLYGERARFIAPRLSAWMEGLRSMEDHLVHFFREHRRAFLLGVITSVAIEILIVAQYHALLTAFGVVLDLPTLLLVLLGSGVARAVPAPAALGALEATQVAVVGASAGRPDLGFVVGVIVRLHETLLLAVGLAVLSYQGLSLARVRAALQRARA
jgi:glycosyltransferase 2 family protein